MLLVDDHAAIRAILSEILNDQPELDLVGEAGSGMHAVDLAHELLPDVILMDINMPGVNGIEATRRICASRSDVAVIGLSMHEEDAIRNRIRSCGALDLVPKDGGAERILTAIRAAARSIRQGTIFNGRGRGLADVTAEHAPPVGDSRAQSAHSSQ